MEQWIKTLFDDAILESAAHCYGVEKKDVFLVGGFENFIYGFTKNNQSYILRISHTSHRTIHDISSELDFVRHLSDHGAPVSKPVLSINNQWVEPILAKDGSVFTVTCYQKAKGERPTRAHVTPEFLFNYGKTIGQFHLLTTQYFPETHLQKRFIWDQDPLLVHAKSYLPANDVIIFERFREIVEEINRLPKNNLNYGLIHTDIHMGNFFVSNHELTVFDFDDSAYMHFVSDIAIALFYYIVFMKADDTEKLAKADFFMTHFMKGYLSVYRLPKHDFLEISKFLKLREMVLYIVFFRSTDVKNDEFARRYVETHRDLIIHHTPVIDLNFEKYYT